MKEPSFEVNMNEYLPLRDVVFNTLRQAILRGEFYFFQPFCFWVMNLCYLF